VKRAAKQANRLDATFQTLATRNEKALIAYVMAGDPSLLETYRIVLALAAAGADIVELGVPFSDPVADGPIIQQAAERALKQGTSLADILVMVATIRRDGVALPIVLMTYCNPVYAFGVERFFQEAEQAGVDGVIVPDLPLEEAKGFCPPRSRRSLPLIFLVAPTTPPDRMAAIVAASSGFIYYVSLTGITGASLTNRAAVTTRIRELKSMTTLPVAAGFGIATPDDAQAVAQAADGIIVGSALVSIIASASSDHTWLERLQATVAALKQAIRLPDQGQLPPAPL